MFNIHFTFHPHTQAVHTWLHHIKIKAHLSSIENTLQAHPNWPSLLCITDTLHQWQIPNAAAKIDVQQVDELPLPFLAQTRHPERPLAIVTKVDTTTVTCYQNNYLKTTTLPRADFLQQWTGVYMIAEPDAQSGEPDYASNKRKHWMRSILPVALTACILSVLLWSFSASISNAPSLKIQIGLGIQFALYLAGLLVSCLLLWYELDKRNPLLQKVCTGIAKGNCNAILTGKASKVFSWLSWSEVGFFYFAGGLLLLAMPAMIPWASYWLGWLGMAAIVYPIFSIYYQWRVAKQWCVLCLAVQAILLLLAINFVVFLSPAVVGVNSISSILLATLVVGLPILVWNSIKPYLLHMQQATHEHRAYLRLKFNTEVFEGLLHKQKKMVTPTAGLGISLGNPHAPNTLVKVCNPYCGPCSKAHPKIEKLLEHSNNLQVQVLFMVPDTPGEKLHTTASHLMAIAQNNNQQVVQQALDDWYMAEKKDYTAFAAKYPLNGEVAAQAPAITEMEKWSLANDIRYTPTIFFNGYELPPEYDPEDLQYFLQE
jgi:uncharacterized membrane protein